MGKKGSHGSGTVYKKGNKYQGAYYKPDGSRGYVSAKTKTECRAKLRTAMADADRGLTFDAGKQTVGEYMTRWLEDFARPKLAPRTYANYRLQLRQHIIPALGHMKLSKLDTPNIQALYTAKSWELAPSSVRYIHAVLHKALGKAVELRLIPRNPAASAEPPELVEEEMTPLTHEQANTFLDAARGQKHECLYVLSLACGLRMGESLGLKWSDIDFEAGTLRVARQLQRSRRIDGVPGKLEFMPPKNDSKRTIDLPQKALESLRSHRKAQLEERVRATNYEDYGLVFATQKGTPLEAQNIVNRHFKPLLERAGLPDIRWHDLRHTCATLLLGRVAHRDVKELLGHKSVSITIDRYSHWLPGMGKRAADGMNDALGS